MKQLVVFLFCLSICSSAIACFCIANPLCKHLQSDNFTNSNGIVCFAEYTGNNPVNTPNFSAYEMKLVDLLYGEIQAGTANYMNTDSTFWVLLASGAACYWDLGFGNTPYLMAPLYQGISSQTGQMETGYALSLCREDILWSNNMDSVAGYIYDYDYITISTNQLPQLINDCILSCEVDLNLTGVHNFPSVFSANSTIWSTADVNSTVKYQANDRIRLNSGFKTQTAQHFSVVVDGCD